MRLGAYPCRLRPGSRVAQVYGATEVSERHRHRYEVTNAYRDVLAEYGMRCSGLSPDGSLVEMIELPDHPWFIGCQFHPELKSRPTRPHPLFAGFIGAALRRPHRPPGGGRRHRPAGRPRHRLTCRQFGDGSAPFLIAGPCVIEADALNLRVAEALAALGARLGTARHLQGDLRQGQSLPARGDTRPRARRRARGPRAGPRGDRPAAAHRRARSRPGGRRGRGRRRAADPGVPVPPDRPAGRRRQVGPAGEREEGAVDGTRGDGGARSRRCAAAGRPRWR